MLRRLLIVLCILVQGCGLAGVVVVDKPPPRVSLKGYQLDLAYGAEPIAPPEAGGQTKLSQIAQDVFDLDNDFPTSAPPARFGPPADPCPEPGPSVVPEEPITPDVRSKVAPGVYLFKQEGTVEFVGLNIKANIKGFTSRIVRNFKTSGETFTYDMDTVVGQTRQVWSMQVVPGDGIFLAGIDRMGQGAIDFHPLLPVEIFPLPAVENTSVTGAGLDPTTGESLVVQGLVKVKQRVSGCDELVDGWFLEGSWSFQGQNPVRYDLSYTVATQHGGLIVGDHVKFTQPGNPVSQAFDITTTFGSITPRPEKPK